MFLRRALAEGKLHAAHLTRPRPRPLVTLPKPRHASNGLHTQRVKPVSTSPAELYFAEVKRLHGAIAGATVVRRAVTQTFMDKIHAIRAAIPRDRRFHEPSEALLAQTFAILCQSSHPRHHVALGHILYTAARFRLLDVPTYSETIFARFLEDGKLMIALHWLCVTHWMPEFHSVDSLPQWHRLLAAAGKRRDELIISYCQKRMAHVKVKPTPETLKILFSALLQSPDDSTLPTFRTMKHVINLWAASVPYDPTISQLIQETYNAADEHDLGARISDTYLRVAKPSLSSEELYQSFGRHVALGLDKFAARNALELLQQGRQPSDDMLITALGEDLSLRNLKHWRKTLGFRGGPKVCAVVMKHILQKGTWPPDGGPMSIYKSELNEGVEPSSDMLYVALQSLLAGGIQGSSDAAIDKAVTLYRDYVSRHDAKAATQEASEEAGPDSLDKDHCALGQPQPKVYQLLLRVLTSKAQVVKRLSDAASLVEDMQRFRVRLDPQTSASVIVILMRSSPTVSEAYRIYRLLVRPANKEIEAQPVLNEEGFAAVLDTFCSLDAWPDGVPSARQYFEIVSDMRKQGLNVTAKIYTIIIKQLAKLASQTPADDATTRELLAKTLTRVHNNLTVNTAFTPDTPLWNQLMDAYQRLGGFEEACRIWETLFAAGEFNNASVSIILDACAFRKAYDVAVRIYTTLVDIGYPMNVRNWNTFLECLCRCDKLDEAMKVLCLEMTGRTDGVEPDQESVRILLKFAARTNQETEVRSRVKRFLPKLYFSLPDDLRLGQH